MYTKKCYNCGADEGLHQAETMLCPKDGIEENRFDKLKGRYYPQQWQNTTFIDATLRKMELSAPKMINLIRKSLKIIERVDSCELKIEIDALIDEINNVLTYIDSE